MITKKTIKKFNDDGFIVVKNFVQKKKINLIYKQLNTIIDHILASNKINFSKKNSLEEKYLILKKSNNTLKSHFYDAIKLIDSSNSIVFSDKMINMMKKILKINTIFITGQRLRLDHKSDPHNLPLHQELNNISNDFGLIWIPLVKVNKKTGSLCLIPKSHKYGHLIYKDSKLPAEKHKVGIVEKILKGTEKKKYDNEIVKKLFDKKNIFFPELNAGDALIFKTLVFHGSTPYKSTGLRWTLLSTFHPFNKVPYISNKKSKSFAIPYDADYN
tara:strand:+ start:10595 stop:11410 length:816 start_codon:yes stop_codon:yes gene_type:complete